MKDFGLAALLFVGLSSFFIIAWVGARFGRADRPLGRFVNRHRKALLVSLVTGHLVLTYFDESEFLHRVDLLIIYAGIFMFVPLISAFRAKTQEL